jgi:hypothetical protein
MTIVTHCYPTPQSPNAGIWLRRVFDGADVVLVGKLCGWWSAVRRVRDSAGPIVACWIFPAGIIAYLSGRQYVIYGLGLDCFWLSRSRILAWACLPVVSRARRIVFSSDTLRSAFRSAYGSRFDAKLQVIRLPIVEGE